MNCKILIAITIVAMLATGCYTKFKHYDLPENHLNFSSEGGTLKYVSPEPMGLYLEHILIDGEKCELEALFNSSEFVGYSAKWISFKYGELIGLDDSIYVIEVQPNISAKKRSATIQVTISAKNYGELYISQDGM